MGFFSCITHVTDPQEVMHRFPEAIFMKTYHFSSGPMRLVDSIRKRTSRMLNPHVALLFCRPAESGRSRRVAQD